MILKNTLGKYYESNNALPDHNSLIYDKVRTMAVFGCSHDNFFIKRRMRVWTTKWSLFAKLFSRMSVTFRDESNESSSTMIGYSDARLIIL